MITLAQFLAEAHKFDGVAWDWSRRPGTETELKDQIEDTDRARQYVDRMYPRGHEHRQVALKHIGKARSDIKRQIKTLNAKPEMARERQKWRDRVRKTYGPDKLRLRLPTTGEDT